MRRITYRSGLTLALLGLMAGVAGPAQAAPTFSFTTIEVPGDTALNEARGINGTGQIVGSYYSASDTVHGFLKDGSTYTTLDVPGATGTVASGINDAGQIVGGYTDASLGTHGFLKEGSTYTTLDGPGATYTAARGINDAGQIVGNYYSASGTRPPFRT
jgi:probable HAF family extracellular repeat protein